jgi:tetratricopeptide (TPR) repeat protein
VTTDDRIARLLESGVRLHHRRDYGRALEAYRAAIVLEPGNAKAHHLSGLALLARNDHGDVESGIACLERSVLLDSRQAAYHNDLGSAYWQRRRVIDARNAFEQAVRLDPKLVQANFNLGNCHWILGSFDNALECYQHTAELNADWVQAHYMRANCLLYLGRTEESIVHYDRAIAMRPGMTDAHLGRAHALLRLGRWQEGWDSFERRIERPEFAAFRASARPQWNGEGIPGGTLLVYAEQGIGDAIQFVRLLPLIRARVGRLVMVCDRHLHSLFGRMSCIDRLIDKSTVREGLDHLHFDARVALMSLARILGLRPEDVPCSIPYLRADPGKVRSWRREIAAGRLRVGLVWAGNPDHKDDAFRSCRLAEWAPMFSVPGVAFYSLQMGIARDELSAVDGTAVVDLSDDLVDFDETAAVVSALDLVVSVDTATAHLAGALGKPVWNLLWFSHCWRYLEGRETTAWYPTMRLFRQDAIGDWAGVIERVVRELGQTASRATRAAAAGDSP